MMRKILAAASLLAISAVQANAATANGNLSVSLAINAICTVGSGSLSFLTSSNLSGAGNIDATGSFSVTCTNGTSYSTTLDNGANGSGSQRRMVFSGNYVNYDIYSDSARTVAWTGAAAVSGTGNGSSQPINVYGRIPSGQSSVPTGTYNDTVTITVTY